MLLPAPVLRASTLCAMLCLLLAGHSWSLETPAADAAIDDAVRAGRALCKVISRNDAGVTGGHQSGVYLPKAAWPFFATAAPVEEENHREGVEITWPDGMTTASVISWYGKSSRSEFRLTRLGDAGDKWLGAQSVGDLWVLVPQGGGKFKAHVLRTEEETDALGAALGIEAGDRWSLYQKSEPAASGSRYTDWARREAAQRTDFPAGRMMAELARKGVQECHAKVLQQSADDRLLAWMEAEYALYREIERRVCGDEVLQKFGSVEEFLAAASTIMNRRKSRAGHSLEEHVEHLLREAGVAFDAQATIDGKVRPDILLPGKSAYDDPRHPADALMVLGLKTTCRDRWRQVLNEGKRATVKHLLTLQPAMSKTQLAEMQDAKLQLIVPAALHAGYDLPDGFRLLTVQQFLEEMKRRFPR